MLRWISVCFFGAALIGCSSGSKSKSTPMDMGMVVVDQGGPMCTPEATRRCLDGHPTWVDSCGVIGERIATCAAMQTCAEGECTCPTTGAGELGCYGNDVYRLNDCGEPVNEVQVCGSREMCVNGSCVTAGCMPADEVCDGDDNDCDGNTDEGDLCEDGAMCLNGRCGIEGGVCSACEDSDECAEGYTCAGYSNFPELGRVCVRANCTTDAQCPEGTGCNDNGLCWLKWHRECRDGNSWNIDTCNRAVSVAEACGQDGACAEGRCVGEGVLCDTCEGNRDCAADHQCRGYSNYEHVPMVCVPNSTCNEDESVMCPDGLQCSSSGVCWMTWNAQCHTDGDPWSIDTCGRRVVRAEQCGDGSVCAEGRCVGEGAMCDVCEADGDCAAGFLCRGYSNFPEVPKVCVPQSDCAENPMSLCPDGLQCGSSGVCWLTWTPTCSEDQRDINNIDTCMRLISVEETCADGNRCEAGACVQGDPPPRPDAGAPPAADAGMPAADAGAPAPADAGVPPVPPPAADGGN